MSKHMWTWCKFIYTERTKNVNVYTYDYFKCFSGESRLVPQMITHRYRRAKTQDQFLTSLCMNGCWSHLDRFYIFPQYVAYSFTVWHKHLFFYSFTQQYTLRHFSSHFQSDFYTRYDVVLPLTISSNLSFP